ncbi:MAG: MerR family transcriptional regulator [Sarcina sp.]
MKYTIKQLAEIAGVSSRTLRYYDEINLLKPLEINSSGYRIYGEKEVDLLQQIMFYKSIDMKLEDIKESILNPEFNIEKALMEHHKNLLEKKEYMEKLILAVEKTIGYNKGEVIMSDKEKFESFKKERISENEKMYGEEIREKYGDNVVDETNNKFLHLTKEEFDEMNKVEEEMIKSLKVVCKIKNLNSPEAKLVFENHKKWLSYNMKYKSEVHRGIAQMYVLDERFASYYNDKVEEEVVETLKNIILKYA